VRNDELLVLIDDIYDAALDPTRWQGVLKALGEATKDSIVVFQAVTPHTADAEIQATHNMDPIYVRSYNDHYGSINPWFLSAAHMLRAGMVVSGEEVVSKAELCRTEFYDGFLKPQKSLYTLNAVLHLDPWMISNLSLVRGPAEGAYSREERDLLQAVLPHLQRALTIHSRVRGRSATVDAMLRAFDGDRTGVCVVGLDGRVLRLNDTAASILAENDGLALTKSGALCSASSETNAALASALRASDAPDCPEVIIVHRPSGAPPLGLRVMPFTSEELVGSRRAFLLLIRDSARQPRPQEAVLRDLFGLTRTEARVVALLAMDRTVAEIADELELHQSTIRSHLKRALSKTGARRQAELVHLVLRSIAALDGTE